MARQNPIKRRKLSRGKFGLRKHGNHDHSDECSSTSTSTVAASKFMSIVSDDLLVEILLRLPNATSVLRCTPVSKRWCSLILSPEFSFPRRFIQYHHLLRPSLDPSYLPDHTFAFFFKFSAAATDPFYYFSPHSKSDPKLYCPRFIPTTAQLTIRACSGDLMLLSEGDRRYYVCNFLTRRWSLLPEIPREDFTFPYGPFSCVPTFALVRYPSSNADPQLLVRYRVVVCATTFRRDRLVCGVITFDSETRLWTFSPASVPFHSWINYSFDPFQGQIAITGNGVLCWMDGHHGNYHCMASLDPSTLELRMTRLPGRQFRGLRKGYSLHKVHTGVVRGRVRISRMLESKSKDSFRITVWELDCGDSMWELVHRIKLQAEGASFLFLLGFDPNDGDAIFVVRDWKIFRYEIGRKKWVEVCSFPRHGIVSETMLEEEICQHLRVFPVVHPLWPTSMPCISE